MGLLDELQSVLTNSSPNSSPASGSARPSGGGLGDLLGTGVLGGLMGALLPGRGGMLKTGGAAALAAMLWNKYKDRIIPPASTARAMPAPVPSAAGETLDPAAARLIRAMVFAAKSDGAVDNEEKAAITARLSDYSRNPAATRLLNQALTEPLDPALVANGVSGPQEAMALFLASCAVIKRDNFMENTYLDALAKALGIPDEMKGDIEAEAAKGEAAV